MRRTPFIVFALCLAEILSMAGTMHFPALQPLFEAEWRLSATAAGWINGVFFAGYAAATPVLVGLTDRIDPRRVYLPSVVLAALSMFLFAAFARGTASAAFFRLLAGIGLAGTYMPGLRALSDNLDGPHQSRSIAFYTSSFGIGAALSVWCSGLFMSALGWRVAAFIVGLGPLIAAVMFARVVPRRPAAAVQTAALRLRVEPLAAVLRNRRAMGYVLGYAVHCWELFGMRSWLVAFLVFAAGLRPESALPAGPQSVATLVILIGVAASIVGNEGAMRWGRRRAVVGYMVVSGIVGLAFGFSAGRPIPLVVALAFVYGVTVTLDSGALTAGLVSRADDGRRGLTMAVYSFAGFGMAFLAPLGFGIILDLGGRTVAGWGLAFASLALVNMTGVLWLYLFRSAPAPIANSR